jgi:YebC/PmpR family DNA-binding regulatory protein
MSGHSKWATTKRKKWAVDAKRSSLFTKLANGITIAARNGGDPSMNFALRLAVDRAKAASMPKENIERAIKRGTGELGGAAIEEIIYEGYGPGGVAILIQCLTDNRQRTVSNIRSLFNKFAGSLAEAGSVAYLFEKKGQIIISQSANQLANLSADKLEELIIESGAENYDFEDGQYLVYTRFEDLQKVVDFFQQNELIFDSSEIIYLPKTTIKIDESKQSSLDNLLDALDDNDDIANVYANMD